MLSPHDDGRSVFPSVLLAWVRGLPPGRHACSGVRVAGQPSRLLPAMLGALGTLGRQVGKWWHKAPLSVVSFCLLFIYA